VYKIILFSIFASHLLSACSTTQPLSVDSNAYEYAQIEYVSEPDSKRKKIGSVVITQRGNKLNIEKALPFIQRKAFELYQNIDVKIANITSTKPPKKQAKNNLAGCKSNETPQFQSKENKLAHHLRNGPAKHCANRQKSYLNSEVVLMITADILN